VAVDRSWFGLTWNQLGTLRGSTAVTLTTRFVREGD
jgi:hypothetical protein